MLHLSNASHVKQPACDTAGDMGAGNSRAAKGGEAFEIDEEEEEHRGCCGCFAKGVSLQAAACQTKLLRVYDTA